MKLATLLIVIILFSGCEEKIKPIITKDKNLTKISCLKLNAIALDKNFASILKKLYPFNDNCENILTLSYKKDIVCTSPYNFQSKSTGNFPQSYLKFEVRKGFKTLYTYYQDLYDNVDKSDVKEAFKELKKDILQ